MGRRSPAGSPGRPTAICWAAALLLAVTCTMTPAWAQDVSLESAVKATYLYKFVPFVQWPRGAFPTDSSPVNICVAGDGPVGDLIGRLTAGQRVGVRPIVVRLLPSVSANTGCQILYAAGSMETVTAALKAAAGEPVLTVTDLGSSATANGIINFVIEDSHVRFEIDDNAAFENRLVLSSKLLSIALPLQRGPSGSAE